MNELVRINIKLLKRLISLFVVYVLLPEQKCLQLPLKFDAGITVSNVGGKLFHSVAAAFVKVMSLYVTVLVRGMVNMRIDSDRRERVGL